MFFLVLVTLGTVTLEPNQQKRLEYICSRPLSFCKRCCHQHTKKICFLLRYVDKILHVWINTLPSSSKPGLTRRTFHYMHSNVSKLIFFIYLVMLHSACTLYMEMDDIYVVHTLRFLVSSR